MGDNMIGPAEIIKSNYLNGVVSFDEDSFLVPIPYAADALRKVSDTHLLVLILPYGYSGEKLKFVDFRNIFGTNPDDCEPCFYNQDWYLNEFFYNDVKLELKWILIGINITPSTRAVHPESFEIVNSLLPSALLCAFVFFAFFLCKRRVVWENDYVWCSDKDTNGDQIYVGRYKDPMGKNKNGFSIHRHLTIKPNYGAVNILLSSM